MGWRLNESSVPVARLDAAAPPPPQEICVHLRSSAVRTFSFMPDENQEPKERKTLDDRAKMTELERIRHSCAHVLATAILRIWPDAQFAAGPPVENGFYYDVELSHRITPEDFPRIEEEMKKEIKANHPFEKRVVDRQEALKDAQNGRLGGLSERPAPSRYKLGNLA